MAFVGQRRDISPTSRAKAVKMFKGSKSIMRKRPLMKDSENTNEKLQRWNEWLDEGGGFRRCAVVKLYEAALRKGLEIEAQEQEGKAGTTASTEQQTKVVSQAEDL